MFFIISQKGSRFMARPFVPHALYAQGPLCFQRDPNTNHVMYYKTYWTFWLFRPCDTIGMVHKENVTVTQRTLCIKSSLQWHIGIVTHRAGCTKRTLLCVKQRAGPGCGMIKVNQTDTEICLTQHSRRLKDAGLCRTHVGCPQPLMKVNKHRHSAVKTLSLWTSFRCIF